MRSDSRAKPRILSTIQLFLCSLTLLVPGCHRPAPPLDKATETTTTPSTDRNVPLDKLLGLMNDRLALMHDVARWKWNEDKPIADPERERALLDQLRSKAADYKLDPGLVESFFRAQIEAAKLMQQDDFDEWNANQAGKFADVPDLAKELRPKIDRLNDELLQALAAIKRADFSTEIVAHAVKFLTAEGVTPAIRERAIEPLLSPVKADKPQP